jgi:outer membrane protein assembly factor BamB
MPEAESDAPSSSLDTYPDPSRVRTRKARGWVGDGTTRRGVLAGLGGILAVPRIGAGPWAATEPSQQAGWPQYHGNARRSGRPAAGDPETPTRTRWTLEVASDGEGRHNRTAPVVAGRTMFTANADGNLVAVDVPSGTVEWSYTAAGGVQIAPAVGDNSVFIGTGDGDMVALDRGSGEEQWSVGAGGGVSAPGVRDGNVYFGQSDGDAARIMAFGTESGDLRWQTDVSKTGSKPYPSAMTAPTSAVLEDAVVANVQNLEDAGGSGLVALDPTDGTEQWQTSLGDVCYPPSLTENTCYAITDKSVNRVSIADGSVRWETVFEPFGYGSGLRITPDVVTIGEDTVYVQEPTGNGELGFVAVNARTGEREWTYATDSVPSVGSGVSTTGSLVYFALQGKLIAVDAENGLEEWSYRLTEDVPGGRVPNVGRRSGSAPILTQDGILVKHLGTVHAVDAGSMAGTDGEFSSQSPTATSGSQPGTPRTGTESDREIQRSEGDGRPNRGFFTNGESEGLLSITGSNVTLMSTLITVVATVVTALDMIRGNN